MEEVKRLIEARQVEAVRKKLGMKIKAIAKYMGSDIISHDGSFGSGLMSSYYDPDDWLTEEERGHNSNDLPVAEFDGQQKIGKIYDGLRIGKNIEMRWISQIEEVRLTFNGYVVFLEVEEKLRSYVPNNDWESVVEKLYSQTKPIEEATKAEDKQKEEKKFFKQAKAFLDELRKTWGF